MSQGEAVQAGAVLIELDAADPALRVDEARTNVALQKVFLAQAEDRPTADVQAARERVNSATAALTGAEARLQQVKAGATASELAGAQAGVRSAQATLAAAEQRLADLTARP